jgi:hypothetical protein
MKRQIAQLVGLILLFLIGTGRAQAQLVVSAKSGTIQYVQGEVFLDSRPLQLPQSGFLQMDNGQTLQTKQGRLEMLLAPDTYLRLAEDSSLRMEQNRLTDTQVALEGGSALIEVVQMLQGSRIQVRFSTGLVAIRDAGLYRLDSGSGELQVFGGSALVSIGHRKATVKRGRMVHMNGLLSSAKYDVDAADEFHQWAAQRSFSLFLVSPDSRMQRHWEPISMGWLKNYNYRMRFFSALYFEQWRATRDYQMMLSNLALRQAVEERRQAAIQEAARQEAARREAARKEAQ